MWIYSYTPIYSCTCNYLSSIEKGHFISPFFSPLVKPAREVPGRLRTHCISSFSTKVLLTLYCAEGNGNPRMLWYSCLGNPMNRGAWWATVHGVTGVRHNLATKPPPRLLCRFKLQPSPLIKSFQRFVYPPIPIRAGKHP